MFLLNKGMYFSIDPIGVCISLITKHASVEGEDRESESTKGISVHPQFPIANIKVHLGGATDGKVSKHGTSTTNHTTLTSSIPKIDSIVVEYRLRVGGPETPHVSIQHGNKFISPKTKPEHLPCVAFQGNFYFALSPIIYGLTSTPICLF